MVDALATLAKLDPHFILLFANPLRAPIVLFSRTAKLYSLYAVDKVYGILSLQLFSQLSGIHCIIPSNFYVSLLLTTLVPIFLAICIGFRVPPHAKS